MRCLKKIPISSKWECNRDKKLKKFGQERNKSEN